MAALGRLPIRPENQHIQLPAKGDGSMEWQGFYDFSHNPKEYNPQKVMSQAGITKPMQVYAQIRQTFLM